MNLFDRFEKWRWPLTVLFVAVFWGGAAHSIPTPSLDRVTAGFAIFPASAPTQITVTSGASVCSTQLAAQGYYEVQAAQTMHCRQTTSAGVAAATDKPFYNPVSYFMYVPDANNYGYLCCIADSTTGVVYISLLGF